MGVVHSFFSRAVRAAAVAYGCGRSQAGRTCVFEVGQAFALFQTLSAVSDLPGAARGRAWIGMATPALSEVATA